MLYFFFYIFLIIGRLFCYFFYILLWILTFKEFFLFLFLYYFFWLNRIFCKSQIIFSFQTSGSFNSRDIFFNWFFLLIYLWTLLFFLIWIFLAFWHLWLKSKIFNDSHNRITNLLWDSSTVLLIYIDIELIFEVAYLKLVVVGFIIFGFQCVSSIIIVILFISHLNLRSHHCLNLILLFSFHFLMLSLVII